MGKASRARHVQSLQKKTSSQACKEVSTNDDGQYWGWKYAVGKTVSTEDYNELASQTENLIVDLASKRQEILVLRAVADQLRDELFKLKKMTNIYRQGNNERFENDQDECSSATDSTLHMELAEAREARENSDKLINSLRMEQMMMTSTRHKLEDDLSAAQNELAEQTSAHEKEIKAEMAACAKAMKAERAACATEKAAWEKEREVQRLCHKEDIERMLRACARAFEMRSDTLTGEDRADMAHAAHMIEKLNTL